MNRSEKINRILQLSIGKCQEVADPQEAFILMQKNVACRKAGLPLIEYFLGGELKVKMNAFVSKIKANRR